MTLDVLVEGLVERFGPHAPALRAWWRGHLDARNELEMSLERVRAARGAVSDISGVMSSIGILMRRSASRLYF